MRKSYLEISKLIRPEKTSPSGAVYREKIIPLRNGYCGIEVNSVNYYLHKLIFCSYHNRDVKKGHVVDHIDGDIHNNDISNLREIPIKENTRNNKLAKSNKTGYSGVHYRVREREVKGKVYRYEYFVAVWNPKDNMQRSKCFSITELGIEKALKLAVEYRKNKLLELNKLGFNYSDRHIDYSYTKGKFIEMIYEIHSQLK